MSEKYTENVAQLIMLAQNEARNLGHNSVDVGHLFIALLVQNSSIASRVFKSMGVKTIQLRRVFLNHVGRGLHTFFSDIPLTSYAKNLLISSWDTANRIGKPNTVIEQFFLLLLTSDFNVITLVLQELRIDIAKCVEKINLEVSNLKDATANNEEDNENLHFHLMLELPKNLSKAAIKIVNVAYKEAYRYSYFSTEHMLLGFLSDENSCIMACLRPYGLDYNKAKERLVWLIGSGNDFPFNPLLDSDIKKMFKYAIDIAKDMNYELITPEILFLALIKYIKKQSESKFLFIFPRDKGRAADILEAFSVNFDDIHFKIILALEEMKENKKLSKENTTKETNNIQQIKEIKEIIQKPLDNKSVSSELDLLINEIKNEISHDKSVSEDGTIEILSNEDTISFDADNQEQDDLTDIKEVILNKLYKIQIELQQILQDKDKAMQEKDFYNVSYLTEQETRLIDEIIKLRDKYKSFKTENK